MKIRKFQAPSLKEALAQVKLELGPEAIIVATNPIRRGFLGSGIEVTAAIDEPPPAASAGAATPPVPVPAAASSSLGDLEVERMVERISAPLRAELRSLRGMIRSLAEDRIDRALRDEVAALRQALAPLGRASAPGELVALETLAREHRIAAPSDKRITVIVGPTGVGKTTTIAKLATRAALIEDRPVAIASLDNHRVGGEEQIRLFADLIGVPLVLIDDPAHFDHALARLDGAERIFVDTAGRSPRDPRVLSRLSEALTRRPDVEVHLALAAGTTAASMDAWRQRCQPLGVGRLLLTKLDEADDLAELVRAPARLGLPVSWVTTGQRVPEDLEAATAERLLALATGGLVQHEELAA